MPTSLPISASRSRSARSGRRLLLGWSLSDWGMFLAAYGIIIGAVLFAGPQSRPAPDQPAPVAIEAR
ncbi:hypothetical protein [Aquabacter cavernae]|uniref:hypothetical protein n=1 Tax=Aquabacter cavernae TaxID=2496029 RepID=UPI000F8D7C97|nr:hypothetical protein [Aquabacter cavernae]